MILVTGGNGIIGGNLVKRLAKEEGKAVVLFDQHVNKESDFFKDCDNIHFVRGDITNHFTLSSIFAQYEIDSIIHCAANVNSTKCRENPINAVEVNTLGTLSLLELARIYDVGTFINIGSASVFGNQSSTEPIYETTLATPMNVYASTKKLSEELVHCYRVNYGMNAVNLRVSWVFGPSPEYKIPLWSHGPIAYYTWKVLSEKKLVEPSGSDLVANFTFIDDVVDGVIRALETEHLPGCLHISSEKLYSNKEVIEFLQEKRPEIQIKVGGGAEPFVKQAPIRGPLVSEYKEQIGFEPKADLKESLNIYFNWVNEEIKKGK
ncbi:NAD(P)-dependent oxidoreductase [bacterium LRH843]|nr:NAD(P)-dependent oxidoreductase [bacterium LRH843]